MLYRILTNDPLEAPERWFGARVYFGSVMTELGVPQPPPAVLEHSGVRFWFTAEGFALYGQALLAKAAQYAGHGLKTQVLRREKPDNSLIVFEDAWQVAVLPGPSDPSEEWHCHGGEQ